MRKARSKGTRKTDFARLRERTGLTVKGVAGLLEISERTAYRYENGETRPPKIVLRALREEGQAPYSAEESGEFTFIDLFAGIGGLRIGFERIGGRCVFTSEWDK